MNYEEIYKKAIAKWGCESQLDMAQEECTELALAIRKFRRKEDTTTFDSMCDEIADVEIMISQIKSMYINSIEIIEDRKRFKLDRLNTRIDINTFE